MARFTLPRDIYFGRGSLEELKNIKRSRAVVVVGGGSMKRFGFLDQTVKYLKEAGMEVELIENVESDDSAETVLKGAKAMEKFKPDVIVSIGDSSSIDAAKAMWVFYEHPKLKFDDIKNPFTIPTLRSKAIFVAIPSTSGTGTEVSAFSVITDYATGIKYPLADYNIMPDVAIVDANIADTMPQILIAHTGMDGLTHAIEAYVSIAANDFTDPLALKAIKMIYEYLYKFFDGDSVAKEKMHYAQCMAGMAFSNAFVGITHSIAHRTSEAFEKGHIPHGCANAMYLPQVIRFNAKDERAANRYVEIARYVGLKGDTADELIDALIKSINDCNTYLSIPSCIKDYGNGMVSEKEFLAKVDEIAINALEDAATRSNPRIPTKEEMVLILKSCYYGTPCEC